MSNLVRELVMLKIKLNDCCEKDNQVCGCITCVRDITNENSEYATVEYTDEEEMKEVHMILARAVGMPEPELFQDESPDLYESTEQELNEYIDLQERMASGMVKIGQASEQISRNKWAGFIYNAWKGKYDEAKNKQVIEDPRNQIIVQWIEYRDGCWKLWYKLGDKCRAISKGNSVYPRYLKIIENREDEKYDPIAHKRAAPELDNRMLLSDEAYAISHVESNMG